MKKLVMVVAMMLVSSIVYASGGGQTFMQCLKAADLSSRDASMTFQTTEDYDKYYASYTPKCKVCAKAAGYKDLPCNATGK